MAKGLSQVFTVIRGSTGGVVYTANRGGAIITRARVTPVNTVTPPRTQIKSDFTTIVAAWEDLSEADREGWNQYALSLYRTSPVGTRQYSGREAFMATMVFGQNCYSKGLLLTPPETDPPLDFGFLPISLQGYEILSAPGTGFQIVGTNISSHDVYVVTGMTGPVPATRHSFKGPYLADSFASTSVDAGDPIAIPITGLVANDWHFVKVRAITKVKPFIISQEVVFRCQATTVGP